MKYSSTYRRFLAVILLLLYIFIATPVQLWHHHSSAATNPESKRTTSGTTIDIQSAECKICQHTYAASINDAAVIKLSTQILYADVSIVLYPHYKFISSASPGNKSPPAV